jgi:hypothetical protein
MGLAVGEFTAKRNRFLTCGQLRNFRYYRLLSVGLKGEGVVFPVYAMKARNGSARWR